MGQVQNQETKQKIHARTNFSGIWTKYMQHFVFNTTQ